MPKFIAQRDVLIQLPNNLGPEYIEAGTIREFEEEPVSKNKNFPSWVLLEGEAAPEATKTPKAPKGAMGK